MDKSEYDSNCIKMQERMVTIMKGLISKMESTNSPIEYLVALSKFNRMMDDLGNSFATLANIEYGEIKKMTADGEPVIVSGAVIKEAGESYEYDYPESIKIIENALKKAKEVARSDGSAKRGSKRNKRDFIISISK
jgi:hypothetical protein